MLAFIEWRRRSLDQGKECRQPLLPIQDEECFSLFRGAVSARFYETVCVPDQQVSSRVATIKRLNEKPDLIPLPNIATLELWELQATLLNVVDKLRDCGHFPLLAREGCYARVFKSLLLRLLPQLP